MVHSQVSLTWDSYKTNICNGFSALQQNGEFVDMTIAADGHFVKVHQILVALSSPYLKDLMTSAPCPHPVIFLNNVNHRTLSLLLEYIYTGEVGVPAECLASFAEAAKSLKIRGLENMNSANSLPVKIAGNTSQFDDPNLCHISGEKAFGDEMGQIVLPASTRKINVKQDSDSNASKRMLDERDDTNNYNNYFDDSGAQDSDDYLENEERPEKRRKAITSKKEDGSMSATQLNLQFTVSIRGSLQVILNRYIYNLQSNATKAGVRRWRCVDYRNKKCTAFVITKGNVVLNRSNLHNHTFHDKKILSKIEKNAVYSTVDEVQGYKEKQDQLLLAGHSADIAEITIDMNSKSIDTDD